MDSSQDELGIDNENDRTIFLRESDPFLPVIPLPEIEEEPLEGGLNAPPTTPLHSPHTFLKEGMHDAFLQFSGFLFCRACNVRWFGGIVVRGCVSRSLLGSYVHQK